MEQALGKPHLRRYSMLFFVHLFFSLLRTSCWPMGLLSASHSISGNIMHSIFYRLKCDNVLISPDEADTGIVFEGEEERGV